MAWVLHTLVDLAFLVCFIMVVVKMFQHGEFNRIRLANKAIARFEAQMSEAEIFEV